jgi:hypothetical protein
LAMGAHGVDIGSVEEILIGLRIIFSNAIDEFVLPHHAEDIPCGPPFPQIPPCYYRRRGGLEQAIWARNLGQMRAQTRKKKPPAK